MPQPPGIAAMPTTLFNAALGLVPDGSLPVRGPDRVAAILPMFDEASGAARALASLLAQRVPVDEVVVSINGGTDATPDVVAAALVRAGYAPVVWDRWGAARTPRTRWSIAAGGPDVTVLNHAAPVSKADSLNLVVMNGLVTSERVLVMDGDTVLDAGFVAALRDGFYRLHRRRRRGRTAYVLEDVALQSGSVTSLAPSAPAATARVISAARSAEYAFATLQRRGQTARIGRGAVFGASRLFTAIGCGFIARAADFPMPADTLTEDHDFTLQVQAGRATSSTIDAADLDRRGLRVVTAAGPRTFVQITDGATLTVETTANARFEPAASMATEDPPRLTAYVGQVERWVGGGLENVLKRVVDPAHRRRLAPNVRFALLAGQFENLAGALLLLALPIGLGLVWPWAGPEAVGARLAAWVLADVVVTGVLVFAGATLQGRATGLRSGAAVTTALRRTLLGLLPLLLLRSVNIVAYVTAATRVVPRFVGGRLREERVGVTWARPRALPRHVPTRSAGVALTLVGFGAFGFVGTANVALAVRPVERVAVQRLQAAPRMVVSDHDVTPIASSVAGETAWQVSSPVLQGAPPPPRPAGMSAFCDVSDVAGSGDRRAPAGDAPFRLDAGAPPYQPLSPWGLKMLTRLVPLIGLLEGASVAYGVPAPLMLQMLVNESDLDPLAVGPTEDFGLSQVTDDALRLLASISLDARSGFANPRLTTGTFSVFDPDFSICAGAAKLAWARSQPGGGDDAVAYARYINPVNGVVHGRVSDRHEPLVASFESVRSMVDALTSVIAAYRRDPGSVTATERALLQIADAAAEGALSVEATYRTAAVMTRRFGIEDPGFYERVLAGLYDGQPESDGHDTLALLRP